jgi:protein-tyrosine-phosphatase/N-acetylglutamate synthase-like GNAT family acetyltransferase
VIETRKALPSDWIALSALLASAGLPTEDLHGEKLRHFQVAVDGAVIVGGFGIEIHGDVGLLRSLVVDACRRSHGLGRQLVNAAEALAARLGIRTLYLLTTTAEAFFDERGYRATPRAEAPATIAGTSQFSSLCPSGSAFMSKTMSARHYNLLFLCTGNSARSILAQAAANHIGIGIGNAHFTAYSAGSFPKGAVNPFALELLQRSGIPTTGLRSKSWDEFAGPEAPTMDFVFTVCDQAAGEQCPYWPGHPMTAHWGLPDPAAVEGTDEQKRKAFADTLAALRRRIELFASLPFDKLDRIALQSHVEAIGSR